MPFITTFLYSQLFVNLPYPTFDFTGQVIIVTGANSGLGLEAARHFLRLNAAKVILAVRSLEKGHNAAKYLIQSTQVNPETIEVWQLDLESHQSIQAFAQKAKQLERLDVVVQNAGILTSKWRLVDGQESHIAINTINAVLLGNLLLPLLQQSAQRHHSRGRLVFVGSDRLWLAKFKEADVPRMSILDALANEQVSDMADRYNVSKLCLLYAVRDLAARHPFSPTSNVVINCLTPGACKSSIFRDESSWATKVLMGMATRLIARTTEQGSRTLVHAASDMDGVSHGRFLMDCKVVTDNGEMVDGERGQQLQQRFLKELYEKLSVEHQRLPN